MDHLKGVITGPRPGRMRDRRGRGRRGPMSLPGPLSPAGVPAHRTPREQFDALVADILAALEPHFVIEPDNVEIVLEEAPLIPPGWSEDVPTSIVTVEGESTRITLFRLPITHRCAEPEDLEQELWSLILQRLGEIWHISPDDLDPRRS